MCGIAGKAVPEGHPGPSSGMLRQMGLLLQHRGPDAEGFHVEPRVGMVHRRLSILDLTGGNQPLYSEDGSVVGVVNGEIYNYQAVREFLRGRGHVFKTNSDSETVIHAYEEWGLEFPEHLRGMFAIALWDSIRTRLVLVRDRLGIKPLYYSVLADGISGEESVVFGSEIKAILVDPAVEHSLNPEALDLYLALRYVPGPETILKHVKKLQPGHILTLENGRAGIRSFWDLPGAEGRDISSAQMGTVTEGFDAGQMERRGEDAGQIEQRAIEAFRKMLEQRVQDHLMADVPVGVLLSGGLDSTAVVAVMSRLPRNVPLFSFSVGYPSNPDEDELSYARLAAQVLKTEHREVILDREQATSLLGKIAWHMDEPVADPAAIPLFVLARRAREEVGVVLSGEGADEILAGYSIYQKALSMEKLRRLGGPLLRLMGGVGSVLGLAGRYQRNFERLGLSLPDAYRGVSAVFTDRDRRSLGHGKVRIADVLGEHFEKVVSSTPLSQMLYLDTKVWLPDDLLVKADKMTMAHSLELRVPFLDHLVVEFATRLPCELKIRDGVGKYLLRQAVGNMVPEQILHRKKKGFPVPVFSWLKDKNGLGGLAMESLTSSLSICRDLFPVDSVRSLVERQLYGEGDAGAEVYTLMFLNAWYEQVIRGRKVYTGGEL